VLNIKKNKRAKFFIIFFALKNTKLLVLKHKILCKHQQKKDLKKSGLRPPTFNNNLDNNDFGFNKPIC